MFLSEVKEGNTVTIRGLDFNKEFSTRLRDMGFCEGEIIKCVKIAMLRSPILYRVKGSDIALRRCDAERIEVFVNE